jgi:RNA polymerase sigma factor (TIGR02999 family)
MSAPEPTEITGLLAAVRDGDRSAFDQLCERLYQELHDLARVQRSRWSGDLTMSSTALVHEAYLKLAGTDGADWQDRNHFLAVASRAMRQVLVNYAERRRAQRRGGDTVMVSLEQANPVAEDAADEVLALHEALAELEKVDERKSRIVECRFFAGLRVRETAEVLGVSVTTVEREWAVASAWLRRAMGESQPDEVRGDDAGQVPAP